MSVKSSAQPSFRDMVNKINGQMQYYEGPPKFLPTSSLKTSQNLLNLNSANVTESLPVQSDDRIDLVQS